MEKVKLQKNKNTPVTDCNGTRTHKHLVPIWNSNHLVKWLSVRLKTKELWVRVPLQSLKLQIPSPVSSKEFLDIQATIECWFTLKRVRVIIITYSHLSNYFTKLSIFWEIFVSSVTKMIKNYLERIFRNQKFRNQAISRGLTKEMNPDLEITCLNGSRVI